MAPHWTYCFVFSPKRVDRGFQIGQICRVTCRWILPAPAMTMSHHPRDSTWASPSLPGPAWPSLRQLRGRHHRAAAQSSREVQEGWKNWFCAKFICCCNRPAQEKYRVFISYHVYSHSSCVDQSWETELKFMKAEVREMSLNWHSDLSTEQVFGVVLLECSHRHRNLMLRNHCTYW